MDLAARTDEELMALYVKGDHAAFRILFERYVPMLTRLTIRSLKSDELVQEVVQQTFFQLHNARNDFDLDRKLRPWVFTIAMNLARGYHRKKGRRKESEIEPERMVSSEGNEPLPMELAHRKATLDRALGQLPDNQREVVVLHWFQDMPFAEVATIVGSTEGAVRVRAHRAYKRLKTLLEKELGNE